MKKTAALILCLTLILGALAVPAVAEETAKSPVAFLMYADGAWATQ
jgi:hypothetical protein